MRHSASMSELTNVSHPKTQLELLDEVYLAQSRYNTANFFSASAIDGVSCTRIYWKRWFSGVNETHDFPLNGNGSLKTCENMNSQYMTEMFILKKCTCDVWDNSLLERPAARLTNSGIKSFKSYDAKIWNLLNAPYRIQEHDQILVWTNLQMKCLLFVYNLIFLSYSGLITLQITIACLC